MLPFYRKFYGNSSSLHSFGREAGVALEESREKIAASLNADENEIIFTSGGTESDNIALLGIALKHKKFIKEHPKGPHIITTPFEHPAVFNTAKYLQTLGFKVKYLNVDQYGIVDVNQIQEAITPATFLCSIIYGHNEIGTLEPIGEIGKITREMGVAFHSDAVQAFGKVPIDVRKENIDLLSLSGHKIYGPKGVGALYIRKGMTIGPIVHGGGHERGFRSGTENIPGIVGLAKAAEIVTTHMEQETRHLLNLRDKLIRGISTNIEQSFLNGHPVNRLPNNAHFRFTAVEGESLLLLLDSMGIAASTGSACSSKKLEPSRALRAIGIDPAEAHGSLRFTLGRRNTEEEVDYLLEILPNIVSKLRNMSPLWG
jgi:cysteine desulfurase